jgi:hypothetical protein
MVRRERAERRLAINFSHVQDADGARPDPAISRHVFLDRRSGWRVSQ